MQFRFFSGLTLLLTGLLFMPTGSARAQAYHWARDLRDTTSPFCGGSAATATTFGPHGEVYTAYLYHGTYTIGGQQYTATTPWNGNFLEDCLLLRQSTTNGAVTGPALLQGVTARISDLDSDSAGNVYALGRFTWNGSVQAGSVTLTAAMGSDFVGKWDVTGNLQWLKSIRQAAYTGTSTQVLPDWELAVNAGGNVTIAGGFRSALTFDTLTLTPNLLSSGVGRPTAFCLQLDSTGNVRWSHVSRQATGESYPTDLAIDLSTGTLFMTGNCTGEFSWGNSTVGNSITTGFWMRLNGQDGALRASTMLTDTSSSFLDGYRFSGQPLLGPGVAAAADGSSFVASYFGIPPVFSPTNVTYNGVPITLTRETNIVVLRLDPNGVAQWARVIESRPDSVTQTSLLDFYGLAVRPSSALSAGGGAPDCYVIGNYYDNSPIDLGSGVSLPAIPIGNVVSWDGFVVGLNGLTGVPAWALPVAASPGTYSEINGFDVDASGRIAVAGNANNFFGPDTLVFGSISMPLPPATNYAGFAAEILPTYNQLVGRVFVDTNTNGTFDPGERPLADLPVEAQPDNSIFLTARTGGYNAVTELGTHMVSLPAPPLYHTLANPPTPATFTSYGNVAAGRDFALAPIPGQQDLQVFVTAWGARPGFSLFYNVTYRNIGTTTMSDSVTFTFDKRLTYLSNSGGGTLRDSTLTVPYASLAPGESRSFSVQFQVPTQIGLGTVLAATASIGPLATDITPVDNVASSSLTVTGSYDPNDIAVNWTHLTAAQVAAGEWLEYTIRFENMGTDTAFTVLLRDSLPLTQLRLGTLQLVAASHSCTYYLAPGGRLVVEFTNIRLPSRATDPLGSTGFMRFRVKPALTLAAGDAVPNQAGIYFDYNAPVITNTALTTVQGGLGLNADAVAGAVNIWPNPTSGTLNVETAAGAGPLHLTLLDALGRSVRTLAAPDARRRVVLDVRGLPAGLYLLRGQGDDGTSFTRRVVVR